MNNNFINQDYLENIRKAFYSYNSFGLWRLEQKFDDQGNPLLDKKGNPVITKVPYNAHTLKRTDPTNPSNGASIDKVIQVLNNNDDFNGVALFLTHDLYFIDIDDKLDEIEAFNNNNYNTIVGDFLQITNTYTELSQSGTGLHIIGRGKKQTKACKKKPVEIYDSKRFVALTGNVFDNRYTLHEIPQEVTQYLENKYLGATQEKNKDVDADITVDIARLPKIDASESEIIQKLEDPNYKHADKFKLLFYAGDWQRLGYESQSNADLGLLSLLMPFTKGDYQKTKNIFDSSALFRPKTHSKRGDTTYFNQTFKKAYVSYKAKKNNVVDIFAYKWNDKGNADRFLSSERAKYVLWVDDQNKWYTFKDGYWGEHGGRTGENLISEEFEEIGNAMPQVNATGLTDEEVKEAIDNWNKHARKLGNRNTVENASYFVKNKKSINYDAFDTYDYLLNCKNGILDLESFELLPHNEKYLITKQIATNYDPNADCPQWKQFINEIFQGDQELIKFVQRATGYSITGSTKEQVMFLLTGKGSNGKGVFTGTIQNLLGGDKNYANTLQAESLLKAKNRGGQGHSDDLAGLKGAWFVASNEPNENQAIDEGLVKQLTGGDMVSASHKGGRTFSYKPQFKIWLSTNHMPHIAGTDDGIWRRLIIIPFDRQFTEDEKDKDLPEKLKKELPGILNWCIEGLKEYNRIGLSVPERLKAIKKDVRQEYNPIARFIAECCEFTEQPTTQQKDLLNAYKDWAIENGEKANLSSKAFGGKIKNIENVACHTKSNGRKFYNIKLNDSQKSYIDTVHF